MKVVFVHIPRTAGRSIRSALEKIKHIDQEWYRLHAFAGHPTIVQLRDITNGGCDQADLKFTVVRNAWDWRHSWYWFLRNEPNQAQVIAKIICQHTSFKDHLRFLRVMVRYGIGCKSHYGNSASDLFIQPQSDYIDGSVKVLRFETLYSEFSSLFGIELDERIGERAPSYWREAYDSESVNSVAGMFRLDIERFGQNFYLK